MVGSGIELGPDVAFQSIAHVVEVALNEITQMREGEDDPFHVAGGEFVEIDDESRWLSRPVVTVDVGVSPLEFLLLSRKRAKTDCPPRPDRCFPTQIGQDASCFEHGNGTRGVVVASRRAVDGVVVSTDK